MKVGQLISMDAGDMLPPELAEILARLRSEAHHMPWVQLRRVLNAAWGADWRRRFAAFDTHPVAAASIGQVHRARTHDGRDLAIKVQYPGVRASIDSDVDNVATLIRIAGLIPKGVDIAPMLTEAKRQLHEEADYECEGRRLAEFGALLADRPEFPRPALCEDFTRKNVLAMDFVEGGPIDDLATALQCERDRVMTLLIGLLFRELFEFKLMQTDPNFANYLYAPATGRIVLLDFGATRAFPEDFVALYRRLLRAGMEGDRAGMNQAARNIGFLAARCARWAGTGHARHVRAVDRALAAGSAVRLRRVGPRRAAARRRHGLGRISGAFYSPTDGHAVPATQVRRHLPARHPPAGARRPARTDRAASVVSGQTLPRKQKM